MHDPGDTAVMDHRDAMRVAHEVVKFLRDPDHAGALRGMAEDFAIDRLCRQHIEAHGRIAGDHEPWAIGQFARDDELLQVAAG